MNKFVLARKMLCLWPLFLPAILLLPGLASFPCPSVDARYSDLTITHYPNAVYLVRALKEWHSLPLWTPAILSGFPFMANPLAGLWYPPGWLALLFPLPLGFNLVAAAHLVWGAFGMYRYLRAEGLQHGSALFGGLAFSFMPKLFAHYGAGHLTLIYAVTWTPWLLNSVAGEERNQYQIRIINRFNFQRATCDLRPAIVMALIALADVRWVAFAGLVWWGYVLAHSHSSNVLRNHRILFSQAILATLLSAPLWIPLIEYTRLSTRAHLTIEETASYSLPAARLLGLLFPDLGSFHEWVWYPGGIVAVFALAKLLEKGKNRYTLFWTISLLASLLFSLGDQLPLYPALARLPGMDLLRVPARALFLTDLSLVALATQGVNRLLFERSPKGWRSIRIIFVALCSFALALVGGVWLLFGKLPINMIWGSAVLLVAAIWFWIYHHGKMSARIGLVGFFLVALVDLGLVAWQSFTFRPKDEVNAEAEEVARFLAMQPGRFRVYSPSYSLPQQAAAQYGLELADGIDPLQLESYTTFMERASGVPRSDYSVTVPTMKTGNPDTDNKMYRPDPALLGLINVRFVVAAFDLPVEGLSLSKRFGETRLYENLRYLPRAWLQPFGTALGNGIHEVEMVSWTPNFIIVRAKGPGLLVLSEIKYPGWQVRVDGRQRKIEDVHDLLRGVMLDEGNHQVSFSFVPRAFYLGLFFGLLGLIITVSILALQVRQRSRAEILDVPID